MAVPKTEDPVFHVRLLPVNRKEAQALAEKVGLPVSSWMRMVILERLAKERFK